MKKMFNKAVLNGTTVMGDGLTYPRIPNVYTGDNEGGYQRGDMMDANAVVEMIKELTDTGKITIEELQNLINEEIQERVEGDQDQQRYTDQKIKDLIGTSPETLDTLKEIADALGEDPDFAANVWNKIAELTTKHNEDVQELQDAITSGFENIDFTPYVKKTDVVTDTTNGLMLASDKQTIDSLPQYIVGHTNSSGPNDIFKTARDRYMVYMKYDCKKIGSSDEITARFVFYNADQDFAGVMSAPDKRKLDGIENSAQVNKIESVSINGTPLEITNKGVNIPNATTSKEGLMSKEDKTKINALPDEIYKIYGIEFDTAISSPTCTRIGRLDLHRTLPIQSKMRGCLLDDDGNVVKYLDAEDWTNEDRTGSSGQVMVEIPMHYRRFETEETKRRVYISELSFPGCEVVPKAYVSAYEATVQHSTSKLCSVVNEATDYRGGNNNADYDGTYRSFLNRPVTSISRTNFRNCARKRKSGSTEWNCMTYDMQKTLYWLFVIEYATLNSQAAYNASPTAEGFHRGGLGDGVSTFNPNDWGTFNGYYPFVPCGISDSLGNRTGVVDYTVNNEAESNPIIKTFQVPRYRGVENPFGHIWQWTDGINVRISPNADKGGDGLSKVFVCSDPAKFNDSNYEGYSHVGNEARTDSYVKEVIFGEGGEIMPKTIGGSSTQFFCDYHQTNIPTTETLRGVLFGGNASNGAAVGLADVRSDNAPSNSHPYIGSRLCFIPATA